MPVVVSMIVVERIGRPLTLDGVLHRFYPRTSRSNLFLYGVGHFMARKFSCIVLSLFFLIPSRVVANGVGIELRQDQAVVFECQSSSAPQWAIVSPKDFGAEKSIERNAYSGLLPQAPETDQSTFPHRTLRFHSHDSYPHLLFISQISSSYL